MAKLIPNFALAQTIGECVEIEASSVDDLIERGIRRFGEPFRKAVMSATIAVNGRSMTLLQGKKTPLGPDDTVWLLLPSGGG